MAKVTFEFDDLEERRDVTLTNERYKMIVALDKLNDFFCEIYNR